MKRTHRNSTRLTARERARVIALKFCDFKGARKHSALGHCVLAGAIERAIQAHARQALARKKARSKCRVERCTRGRGHIGAHVV
jgi:hypothetical protein